MVRRRGRLLLYMLLGSVVVGAVLLSGLGVAGPLGGAEDTVQLIDVMAREDPPEPGAPPSDGVVDVRDFGAVGDGFTDDTAAIQAAIDSLAETGGIVFFPAGTYRVQGQIALPNDGEISDTRQPAFVFRGVGAFFDSRQGIASGGTILDMRYGAGPKIVTYGLGLLETTGITFASFGGDSEAFIYTTNTTLHIHDCGFYGNKPNHTADNDAIILGGTNSTGTGGIHPNAPFQGYGTVIRDNYFARVRRAVYGRVFANAIVVTGNTIWKNCGSNLTDGAAIELDGDPDGTTEQVNGGWYVAGNLIEVTHYPYGIKVRESQRNAFIANNFYDPLIITNAYYLFEETGKLNYVLAGFHDDTKTFVEESAAGVDRNTIIDFHQAQESRYAQKSRFMDDVFMESANGEAPHGPRLIGPGGTELTYQLSDDTGMLLWYTPATASPVELWQVQDLGDGNIVQDLKGSDAQIRNLNGSVKLQSSPGSALELGDTSGQGIEIEDGDVTMSSTGVQILTGSGPPTANAPDGSIYLRTDGGTKSTLYVRISGLWIGK